MIKYYEGQGNQQPQWKLNYITRYAGVYSPRYIADRIDVSVEFVLEYCRVNGLPLSKKTYTVQRIRRFERNEPVKIVRPKAVYSNRSREQIIEELLNA